jgi:GNAT superfamily N-acetyltransferase
VSIKPLIKVATLQTSSSKEITALINTVYAVEEANVWEEGHLRVSEESITESILNGEIITAHIKGDLVAAVQTKIIAEQTGWFGMLVVAQDYRKRGLAQQLYQVCENLMIGAGCKQMQCEVLIPERPVLPLKNVLKLWYGKLGYRKTSSCSVIDMYPKAKQSLLMDCDLEIYTKSL